MTDSPASLPHRQRLKFIDLARAIAILLMLEGHFIALTLAKEFRDLSHPVYWLWHELRGFTAPLFFTVSGMIFVFLLAGEGKTAFFRRVRVRKGIRRALELLVWGYALQINVRYLPHYLRGEVESWVESFHVLQCIGVGLLVLIALAGIAGAVGRVRLECWYVAAAAVVVVVYGWLLGLPPGAYVPHGWPEWFQNAIRGPDSLFPVVPWLAFAFLGGGMGAYLRSVQHQPLNARSCLWFLVVGLGMQVFTLVAFLLPLSKTVTAEMIWFSQRSFQVVLLVGLLRWVEIRFGLGVEWLLRTGRETFAIYIAHVIVLYGGFVGVGIDDVWQESLGPWQAAGAALVFLGVFVGFAQWWHRWKVGRRPGIGNGTSKALG